MRKWYVPLAVLGVAGVGALLLTDRGRQTLRWLSENLQRAVEWNEAAQRELDRIQVALNRVAESLEAEQKSCPSRLALPFHLSDAPGAATGLGSRLASIAIKPLLLPGVAIHVIAIALPEARGILIQKLHSSHPLHGLPGVQMGNYQTQGIPVLRR